MKIACIQHDIVWEDKAANFERLAPMIAGAAASDARVVLLSETFSTGFSMQTERTAESPGGPSSEFLLDQATRHGIWVGGSYPEITEDSHGDRPFNTFALAGPAGSLTKYRKVHPFSYGKEHEHFSAGDTLCTVEIDRLRVALFVCYDLRFADEFWQLGPEVDAYFVVANWPAETERSLPVSSSRSGCSPSPGTSCSSSQLPSVPNSTVEVPIRP